jgi:hypothetical protein
MDMDARIIAEPDRVIIGIVEEEIVVVSGEDGATITNEEGTRCKIITVKKAGETTQVCVALGEE